MPFSGVRFLSMMLCLLAYAVGASGCISHVARVDTPPPGPVPGVIGVTHIAALPEAGSRPAAAAALGAAYNHDTLSLTAAASLLRGLPIETLQDTITMSAQHTLTAADYSNFQRKAELRCAGLTQSGNYGNKAARDEANRIRTGLHIVATTGVSYGAAFAAVGLDARATISKILGVTN